MSQMIIYSVPWTYKKITIELRYNYKTIPVARLWMARVIPSFGSQSKRAKIAIHLFAQNFYIRTRMGHYEVKHDLILHRNFTFIQTLRTDNTGI